MSNLLIFSFEDYTRLRLTESGAIQDYMDRNDPIALGKLIQQGDQLTPDFRRFIADLVTGKKKRPIKKASTFDRDCAIYQEIEDAAANGSTKTAIKKVIAKRINRSVDAVQKSYEKAKEAMDEYKRDEEESRQEAIDEYWEAKEESRQAIDEAIRRDKEKMENPI